MEKEKEFKFTEEFMDGFIMKVPDRCMIKGCCEIAEYFNEDFGLCLEHYHDISDEIEVKNE